MPPCTVLAPHTESTPAPSLLSLTFTDHLCFPTASAPASPFGSAVVLATEQPPMPCSLVHEDTHLDLRSVAALSLPAKRARKPQDGNEIEPSIYRLHVPADRRVLLWMCRKFKELLIRPYKGSFL
ncbi:hypothetical protein B0H17DRAFT_1208542 [Mycena rosella]|uniref:Uncharacterized protein n=1 Tax=Mycena rosella TaxID=1033263 RepID=A0AAD7G725_MYCRO|nr:hypothetical protein B0H17DRAFT_1208542 [Mycena rosella]